MNRYCKCERPVPDENGLCFECDGVVIRSVPDPDLVQLAIDAGKACPDEDDNERR